MATHKSAEKRHRQSLKRRARNRFAKSTVRGMIKDTLEVAKSGDKKAIAEKLRQTTKLLDKAAIHGIYHKKTAQRHISRLAARVHQLSASK